MGPRRYRFRRLALLLGVLSGSTGAQHRTTAKSGDSHGNDNGEHIAIGNHLPEPAERNEYRFCLCPGRNSLLLADRNPRQKGPHLHKGLRVRQALVPEFPDHNLARHSIGVQSPTKLRPRGASFIRERIR